MAEALKLQVIELDAFHDQEFVFQDRSHAGRILADMLESYRGSESVVMAVPAGGVEVAVEIAQKLKLELDVAVVNKITPVWSTEVGYGAVAFDGTVIFNDVAVARFGLEEPDILQGAAHAQEKVQRRVQLFRGGRSYENIAQRDVILVDDGLATGYTFLAAAKALKNAGAAKIIAAVPTAHTDAIHRLEGLVDLVYCPNIRSGWGFAVADAYRNWRDVREEEVVQLLETFKK